MSMEKAMLKSWYQPETLCHPMRGLFLVIGGALNSGIAASVRGR
jgi:hypothetical protein